ncbi:Wadjet anti-phage system protein JetD domain-containing protein [Streptomyces sp. C8S0]|uniref:Wadjet anti-phage system protein JetD domain-containing protein n=1 Tax=Streptomyces sp. C8S0 TaxID=2585716 RepID=UPI001D045A2F|nr:Wadjet anti-phage system protein JetD domain-containing protein [Streptomyces sp. C8S0]
MISCDAQGIFLIENEDTFEQVCKIPEIADTWLCIWGKGYATDGLAEFLRGLDGLPVAAWGDLDAHGIRIIGNLADRIGRPITPVAMTVNLYRGGTKYRQEPQNWRRTTSSPPGSLRRASRPCAIWPKRSPEPAGTAANRRPSTTKSSPHSRTC